MRIEAAAIIHRYRVVTLPRPARHHDIIRHIVTELGAERSTGAQGFVTDAGRYVGRREALTIARAAGQLLGVPHNEDVGLFSEDVW